MSVSFKTLVRHRRSVHMLFCVDKFSDLRKNHRYTLFGSRRRNGLLHPTGGFIVLQQVTDPGSMELRRCLPNGNDKAKHIVK